MKALIVLAVAIGLFVLFASGMAAGIWTICVSYLGRDHDREQT